MMVDGHLTNMFLQVGSVTLNHLIGELRHRNNFSGYTSVEGVAEQENSEMTYLDGKQSRDGIHFFF